MLGSTMFLTAAIVLGQVEAKPDSPVPQLKWRVGEWKKELTDAAGKIIFVTKETAAMELRDEILVIRHETEWTNRDDLAGPGMTIMYWESSTKNIKCWQHHAGKTIIQGTLVSAIGNTLTWDMQITFGGGDFTPGSIGKYKVVETLAEDRKSYSEQWTKVEGAGADEVGPIKHQRLK